MMHPPESEHSHFDRVLPDLRRNAQRPNLLKTEAMMPHEPSWVSEFTDHTHFDPKAAMRTVLGDEKFRKLVSSVPSVDRLLPTEQGIMNHS